MKRTLIALAAAATLGAAGFAATQAFAHGPGWGAGPTSGYGMMRGGYGPGGPGMMGYGHGPQGTAPCPAWNDADDHDPLTLDQARQEVEQRLQWMGNPRLKLGKVEVKDDDTFVAEIVTVDGSLVDTLEIDRDSGFMRPVR